MNLLSQQRGPFRWTGAVARTGFRALLVVALGTMVATAAGAQVTDQEQATDDEQGADEEQTTDDAQDSEDQSLQDALSAGEAAEDDTTETAGVLETLSPVYDTTYRVNRQTRDWLQSFDFGADFDFMNFTNKTNFDVSTDDGRHQTRRNGKNLLDMRWLFIPNVPITTNLQLERTSDVRPIEERQVDFGNLNLGTRYALGPKGNRHTFIAGAGLNRRTQTNVQEEGRSKAVDAGWTGNASYKGVVNVGSFAVNTSASERRIDKTSTLDDKLGGTQKRPTKNLARNYRVSVGYDPRSWVSGDVGFTGSTGDDEYFLASRDTLETKSSSRREFTASLSVRPLDKTSLSWNVTANNHDLSYDVNDDIASSGNGYSWSGQVKTQVVGSKIDATLSGSSSILEPATSADTDTRNNKFEGKLSRDLSSKISVQFDWLARATQIFFSNADEPNLLDRDEFRTKLQPALTYNPGNKWSARVGYIRSTTRQVQLNPQRANQTKEDEDFTVDFTIGYEFSERTRLRQIYSIKALYTTFDFASDSNRLLATQRITTNITSDITPRVNLSLEHRFTLQDSGPFRLGQNGERIFSRSIRKYRQELSTDLRYQIVPWIALVTNSRFVRTDDLQIATDSRSVSRTLDLGLGSNLRRDFGGGLNFSADGQYVRSNTQDSHWIISSNLTKNF